MRKCVFLIVSFLISLLLSCGNVSYETSESEREIIRATNDFSFRLFQSVVANSNGKDILISPLGVVYSLELISNGAGGHTHDTRFLAPCAPFFSPLYL
jgi:serpin B